MPDQEQLDDFLEALEKAGSPAKNPALRQALGWDEAVYEEVKAELVAKGIVTRGRGRSDSVSLVGAEPVAPQAVQVKAPRRGKALGNLWATGVLALFEAGKASFDLAWTLRLLPGRATDSSQRHPPTVRKVVRSV